MMTRRGLLQAGLSAALSGVVAACARTADGAPADGGGTETAGPVTRHTYGSDPAQYGELYLPAAAGPYAVVVVLHGGFWRAEYDLSLGAPLATDLAARGYAAWNLEYRRLGGGGGWPTTLQDVAAGVDLLAELVAGGLPLDLSTVATVGHSAGGQLAVWAAARPGLPADAPGAAPAVRVSAAVSQAGVLDLRRAAEQRLGSGATQDLLGGDPDAVPERYTIASPAERVPIGVPVLCVHGRSDDIVPPSQSEGYAEAARAAGDSVALVEVDGDHFTMIDVGSEAWTAVTDRLPELLAG